MILLLVAKEVDQLAFYHNEGDSSVLLCIRLCRVACLFGQAFHFDYLSNI